MYIFYSLNNAEGGHLLSNPSELNPGQRIPAYQTLALFMVHYCAFVVEGASVPHTRTPLTPLTPLYTPLCCLPFLLFSFIFIVLIVLIVFIVYSQHIFTPTQIAEQSARLFAHGSLGSISRKDLNPLGTLLWLTYDFMCIYLMGSSEKSHKLHQAMDVDVAIVALLGRQMGSKEI